METLTIQPVRKFKHRIAEVQEAFQVGNEFNTIIFKQLVVRLRLIIKVQFVRQAGTSAAYNPHTKEIRFIQPGILPQLLYLFPCFFTDVYHK